MTSAAPGTPGISGPWPQSDDGGNGAGVIDGHATGKYKAFRYKNILDDGAATRSFVEDYNQHVFDRGTDGRLKHWYWGPSAGNGYQDWGGGLTDFPVAYGYGRQQHVFGRGADGRLKHWFWDPAQGSGYQDWGGDLAGAPVAYTDDEAGPALSTNACLTRGCWQRNKRWDAAKPPGRRQERRPDRTSRALATRSKVGFNAQALPQATYDIDCAGSRRYTPPQRQAERTTPMPQASRCASAGAPG